MTKRKIVVVLLMLIGNGVEIMFWSYNRILLVAVLMPSLSLLMTRPHFFVPFMGLPN